MNNLTRRRALLSLAALSTSPLLLGKKVVAGEATPLNVAADKAGALPENPSTSAAASKVPRPLVHLTDLFRPHDDPDDHWDLSTGYAMTCQGDLDLLGVLTDNPENHLRPVYKDACCPDVAAVAQLNYLTDRAVPVTTGTIWPTKTGEKDREENLPKDLRGVNMLLNILKRSSQPVAIMVGGTCQDVAIAGKKEPRLFSEKCAGIYLNAGVGSQNPKEQKHDSNVEWNVHLNRGAYASIFELPSPIYWMPCFNALSGSNALSIGEYGAFWSFKQKEVLPYLSDDLQTYFAYVLSKESGGNWLSYLLDSRNKSAAQFYLDDERGMYCTAGFVHAAGKTVTVDGKVVLLEAAGESAAFEFVPIEVRCDEDGITEWQRAKGSTDRYIFRVRDKDKYATAMVSALKSTLLGLS